MRKGDTEEKREKADDTDFIGSDELLSKKRKGKRQKEEADPFAELDYEERITAHKRMIIKRVLYAAAACAVLLLVFMTVRHFVTYSSYKVVNKESRSAGTSVQYIEFYGKLLRYSKDGAVYCELNGDTVWNATYEMHNPEVDVCGQYAVVADLYSTNVCVFDLEGKTAAFAVEKPIQKVQVSEKGSVALLLQDGEEHLLQYYDSAGTLVAEGKMEYTQSGYPLDMTLSDDGYKLMVSYVQTSGGAYSTRLDFYSFSSVGEKEIDNVVSSQTYDGVMIPSVHYADDNTAFAFAEDRLLFFTGSQKPEQTEEITFSDEIKSVFYDDKYAGLIFADGDGYRMELYDLNGRQVLSQTFDFAYTDVKLSGDSIILYNSKEWCVYTRKGRQKLSPCDMGGSVTDIIALSGNKYMLIKANKTQTVKLKL